MSRRLIPWLLLGVGCNAAEEATSSVTRINEVAKSAPAASESPTSPEVERQRAEPSAPSSQVDLFPSTAAPLDSEALTELVPKVPAKRSQVPMRLPSSVRIERARTLLQGVVEHHGRDPARPAVLVHSLLARGPELRTTDGRLAIDALFSDWATATPSNGVTYLSFPRRSGSTPVEAHRGIILKTLTEIGVSPETPVEVDGESFTLADLYRSTLVSTWISTSGDGASPTFSSPRDMAWTLQGLSSWSPPEGLSWKTLDGHTQTLEDFAIFNFAVLHFDTQPLFQAQSGDADFEKYKMEKGKKVGVGPYQHSCGAAHALQASAYAAARGHGATPQVMQGIQGHISNMFWRLGKELKITDSHLMRTDLTPQEVNWLLVQQLKTTGHFLESMSKLSALGYYTPDASQQAVLVGAMDRLIDAVLKLELRGTLTDLPSFLETDRQLFMDLVNDSAHALNGLELAIGDRTVAF